MAYHTQGENRPNVETWELELVKKVARRFRTHELDELEAEVSVRLLKLKLKRPAGIINWRDYLAKSLFNAGHNFIKASNIRQSMFSPLEIQPAEKNRETDETVYLKDVMTAYEDRVDLRLELAEVWQGISPKLKEVWELLVEEEGNKSSVARRLGKSLNTVKYRSKKIKVLLELRGLG